MNRIWQMCNSKKSVCNLSIAYELCVWMTREGQEHTHQKHIHLLQRFNWLKFDIFTHWCRILMKSVGHWIVENFRICSLCLLSGTFDIKNIHVCVCLYIYLFTRTIWMRDKSFGVKWISFELRAITWLVVCPLPPFDSKVVLPPQTG